MRPDDVFGPELASAVTHDDVLAYVKRMKPRDIPLTSLKDVITILEYVQEDILRTQEAVAQRAAELDKRDAQIAQAEQELSLRQRAVDMLLGKAEPKRRFAFF